MPAIPSPESKLPGVGTTIFTVASRLAEEYRAVNLGQGFPDFEPPPALIEALAEAARQGRNQYAPMAGVAALRDVLAARTQADYGYAADPATGITITAGASEALFDAVHAVVRPGDEVIVLDPCYDSYEPAVRLAGGRAVHVPLRAEDFAVDWQRVGEAITPRTRMLVINSPHNPSGATWSAADLETLAGLLRETPVQVLSDEVYEHMVYDGAAHQSVLRHPELAARSFVVSSLGKSWHCTGWKIGYCVAPPALTAELRKVHQFNNFCVFAPAQHAFARVLRQLPDHARELAAFYQAKRDRFRALLAGTPLELLPVPGGYFQVADYTAVSPKADVEVSEWLVREHGVAVIPMSPFYPAQEGRADEAPRRRLRLCFAKQDATLEEGARRLSAAFSGDAPVP